VQGLPSWDKVWRFTAFTVEHRRFSVRLPVDSSPAADAQDGAGRAAEFSASLFSGMGVYII
jgi:hypothetical protein